MNKAYIDHVELTFPRGALTKETRADIDSFWCDVLGWTSREHFVYGQSHHLLQIDEKQFILLGEVDDPMKPAPEKFFGDLRDVHNESIGNDYRINGELRDDWITFVPHFALKYETLDEVDEFLEKCDRFQEKDPRLLVKNFPLFKTGRGEGTTRNVLVRYLLPMWVEIHASWEDPNWLGARSEAGVECRTVGGTGLTSARSASAP